MTRPDYQSRAEMKSGASFPAFKTVGEKPKGPLEKFLSVFADVRAGEGAGALILLCNVFLLLAAYYLLKTAREPLVLTEGGPTVKAYSSAGQAALLIILVPLYGLVGSKVTRLKLVMGLTLFFASHLLLFQALGASGMHIGVAFYIWVGIFNVFVISQFWAFANDIYTESQGKRLFPMIGVGASVGAFIGSQAASTLFKEFKLTPYTLMTLAAGALLVCALLTWLANRIETRREGQEMALHADEKLGPQDGFALIFRDRYLLLIATLVVVLNLVNSTGEFLLSSLVEQQAVQQFAGNKAAMQGFIGGFYGDYFRWVNLLGIVLQTFFVSRIINFMGVRGALYILPGIALVSYSILAVAPILAIVRGVKTLENATDYSLQNTVRQALFLPTSREAKYKAKAAVDTFFMRFGDVLQGGVVKAGTELSVGFTGFAWFNVGMTIVWLWIASQLHREHRRMRF
jgi:AAA family ATP:ADP antiporter